MKNKPTALDELRAEREKLQQECIDTEQKIAKDISYVKENFGSLLLSTISNSTRSSFRSLIGASSPAKKTGLSNSLFSALPAVWNIAQPFVASWATKKITSFIFGKKRE